MSVEEGLQVRDVRADHVRLERYSDFCEPDDCCIANNLYKVVS